MLSTWIFDYIRCPITHRKLQIATESDFALLRRAFEANRLINRLGERLAELPTAGLVDESHQWFYPMENGIPTLLADAAISISPQT